MYYFSYFSYFLYEEVGTLGQHITYKIERFSVQIPLMGQAGMGFGTQRHYEALGSLQVGLVECVPLTISYHLYFLCISKVLNSYITSQWGKFSVRNTLCFYIYFLHIFLLFFVKKCVFIIFIFFFFFFFFEASNLQNRLLTNQKSAFVIVL